MKILHKKKKKRKIDNKTIKITSLQALLTSLLDLGNTEINTIITY